MNHQDILRTSSATLNERGKNYGDVEFMFDLICNLATLITGREFTPYDVAVIHECTKLARRRANPQNVDHYVDGINYMAFAGQFARYAKGVPAAHGEECGLDPDIKTFAKKFAPVKEVTPDAASTNKVVVEMKK